MGDEKKQNESAVPKTKDQTKDKTEETIKDDDLKNVAGGLSQSPKVAGDGLVSCC
ncbi:MAG TPA: hypothetical protein VGK22_02650 [Candidatus Angelobacter sp.]|jgi:hypothetical protein